MKYALFFRRLIVVVLATLFAVLSFSTYADEPQSKVDRRLFGSGKPRDLMRPHSFYGAKVPHVSRRRGLAIIADFADNRLEDWQGEGINTVSELSAQLHKMEEHWAWLSRGQEKFRWDIVRVTLPVTLRPDAYASWSDYRDAVGTLVRQQVDVRKYDTNHDDVIDSAWIIAANQNREYDYLIGGASRNAGVNIFVDGQSTLSVTSGATGNFNHEVAHTLGVPDIYGSYDTLHYLTLMSDSWPVPPQDFTAYERTLLGWVKPRLLSEGKQQVFLSTVGQRMDAIRVSTSRASEYFLIEYRKRPDSGFGSSAPAYNGLAIYHVLEGSNQQQDPPLLKLEAADGDIAPSTPPEINDFLYPNNPDMKKPLVLRSYFSKRPVFRINNLQWVAKDKLAFDINVMPTASIQTGNLLYNASFEKGANVSPNGWAVDSWTPSVSFGWERWPVKEGRRSVSIKNITPNDARWIQTVSDLDTTRSYGLCGWIKGENIVTAPDAQVGANLSVLGGFVRSESLSGTFDWKQTCVTFRPESSSVILTCRLGFFGSTVTGKAWCDDMSLVPMRSAFD